MKQFYDWDEEEKEKDKHHKKSMVERKKRCDVYHLVLQENSWSDDAELTTCVGER
jgi:hypothetical protein